MTAEPRAPIGRYDFYNAEIVNSAKGYRVKLNARNGNAINGFLRAGDRRFDKCVFVLEYGGEDLIAVGVSMKSFEKSLNATLNMFPEPIRSPRGNLLPGELGGFVIHCFSFGESDQFVGGIAVYLALEIKHKLGVWPRFDLRIDYGRDERAGKYAKMCLMCIMKFREYVARIDVMKLRDLINMKVWKN